MSFTHIGTDKLSSLSSLTGNNTNFTVTAGTTNDLRVFCCIIGDDTSGVSSLSGGGVTTWTHAGATFQDSANNNAFDIWYGTITSAGTSLTVNFSSSISSTPVDLYQLDFRSSNSGSLSWITEGYNSISSTGTATNFPNVSSVNAQELYVGFLFDENTGAIGSTSGFVYPTPLPGNQSPYCYNLNLSGGTSYQPTATQSSAGSNLYAGVAVIIDDGVTVASTVSGPYYQPKYNPKNRRVGPMALRKRYVHTVPPLVFSSTPTSGDSGTGTDSFFDGNEFVQLVNGTPATTDGTSASCSINSTTGNTLIAVVTANQFYAGARTVSSIADSSGTNTWTKASSSYTAPNQGNSAGGEIWFCNNAHSVTSVTATFTNTVPTADISVIEVSNLYVQAGASALPTTTSGTISYSDSPTAYQFFVDVAVAGGDKTVSTLSQIASTTNDSIQQPVEVQYQGGSNHNAGLQYSIGFGNHSTSYTAAWSQSGSTNVVGLAAFFGVGPTTGDSGTGIESASSTATLSSADTGTGAETHFIALSDTDNGTGAEDYSTTAAVTGSDTGTGSETPAVTVLASDAGTGSEVASTASSLSSTDSGTGTETNVVSLTSTDSGTGTEGYSTAATLSGSDIGTASETPTVSLSSSDSGTGTESATSAAAIFSTDTGAGSESYFVSLSSAETATGTEGYGIALSGSDTGTATDTPTVSLAAADIGTEIDGYTLSLPVTDSGTGVEGYSSTATVSGSDTGLATDTPSVSLASADAGAATEGYSSSAGISGSDAGTSSETPLVSLTTPDTGTSAEGASSLDAIAGSDTGATTESSSEALSSADTTTGTEGYSSAATLSGTDSGSGIDSPQVSLANADTGSDTESASSTATLSSADTGTATESQKVSLTAADSGGGAEGYSSSSTLSGSDTGSSSETPLINLTTPDTGTTTESASSLDTLASSDSGSDVESSSEGLLSADSGIGVEGYSSSANISGSDTASSSDTPALALSSADAGTLTDNASLSIIPVFSADSGTSAEAQTVSLSDADSGSGVEGYGSAASVSSSDTGASAESPLVSVTVSDTASTVEIASLVAALTDVDTGSTTESAIIYVSTQDTGGVLETGSAGSAFSSADVGSSAESALASVLTTDIGVGTEGYSSSAGLAGADTASSIESPLIFTNSTDTSSAVEASSLAVAILSAENGSATESYRISMAGADGGSGTDVGIVSSLPLASADTGTSAEAANVSVLLTSSDLGNFSEFYLVKLSSAESGTAVDLGYLQNLQVFGFDSLHSVESASVQGREIMILSYLYLRTRPLVDMELSVMPSEHSYVYFGIDPPMDVELGAY